MVYNFFIFIYILRVYIHHKIPKNKSNVRGYIFLIFQNQNVKLCKILNAIYNYLNIIIKDKFYFLLHIIIHFTKCTNY